MTDERLLSLGLSFIICNITKSDEMPYAETFFTKCFSFSKHSIAPDKMSTPVSFSFKA